MTLGNGSGVRRHERGRGNWNSGGLPTLRRTGFGVDKCIYLHICIKIRNLKVTKQGLTELSITSYLDGEVACGASFVSFLPRDFAPTRAGFQDRPGVLSTSLLQARKEPTGHLVTSLSWMNLQLWWRHA